MNFTEQQLEQIKKEHPEWVKSEYPYEEGEMLFVRSLFGETLNIMFDKDAHAPCRLGLIFKTEEALKEDNKLRSAIQRVKDYIRLNDIDVGEFDVNRDWHFCYDDDEKGVVVDYKTHIRIFNPLGKDHWIKNEAHAKQVAKACRDDLILIYK